MSNDLDEKSYALGSAAAWRQMMTTALANLPGETGAPERMLVARTSELHDVRLGLRRLCAAFGNNDWPDSLHLGDVIEKYLEPFLHDVKPGDDPAPPPSPSEENGLLDEVIGPLGDDGPPNQSALTPEYLAALSDAREGASDEEPLPPSAFELKEIQYRGERSAKNYATRDDDGRMALYNAGYEASKKHQASADAATIAGLRKNDAHAARAVELFRYMMKYAAHEDWLIWGTKKRANQAARWVEEDQKIRASEPGGGR